MPASGMKHKASQGVHSSIKHSPNVWYFVLLPESTVYLDTRLFF